MSPPLFESIWLKCSEKSSELRNIKSLFAQNKTCNAVYVQKETMYIVQKKLLKQKKLLLILKWPKNMHAPISNLNKFLTQFLLVQVIHSLWTWQTATLLSRVCDIEERSQVFRRLKALKLWICALAYVQTSKCWGGGFIHPCISRLTSLVLLEVLTFFNFKRRCWSTVQVGEFLYSIYLHCDWFS